MERVCLYLAGGLLGLIGAVLGGVPDVIVALLVLMGIDILTGVLAATVSKNVRSSSYWVGVVRKLVTLCILSAVAVLDMMDAMPVKLLSVSAGAFCAHEFISIIENAGKSGLWLPRQVLDAVAVLRGREVGEKTSDRE